MKDDLNESFFDNEVHGRIYWLFRHSVGSVAAFCRDHKVLLRGCLALCLFICFSLRAVLHPVVLGIWKYQFILLLVLGCLLLCHLAKVPQKLFGRSLRRLIISSVVSAACIFMFVAWGASAYNFTSLAYRYWTLNRIELDTLPVTVHDRILPRQVVVTGLMQTFPDDSRRPTTPDYVRMGEEYGWSYAVVPGPYFFRRLFGEVYESGFIPGSSPVLNLDNIAQKVRFPVGELLPLGRNTLTAAIWSLNPWRYFSHEPADVFYLRDDGGKLVQVVSFIKWSAIPFPIPEFGGVLVIPQGDTGLLKDLTRIITGVGYWVSPNDLRKYKFLQNQNILPYAVSRYIGESFRFQNGFTAPLFKHLGDIRVPESPGDLNRQPYVLPFLFTGVKERGGQLVHYFALEPWDKELQGLNTSVFILADGRYETYVYRHHAKKEVYVGTSAISGFVYQSKPNFQWGKTARAVEHRPYFKNVSGKIRPFMLTTVVALDENDPTKFVASGHPYTVITYPKTGSQSIWVDSSKPSAWIKELESAYSELWEDETMKK